jgi:peptidoglycan-N-acetylglucosamine deacetylase
VVALTFDDGPDPRGTPAVLDALARAGVRASFFVLGERTAEHPELLARVLAEGHRVEVHGYGHPRHSTSTRAAVAADIDAQLDQLSRHGVTPRMWRAPYGALAPWTAELAAERGLRLAGWTHDTNDWRGLETDEMLAAALPALRDGAVVLAHDGVGEGALRSDCEATARLVEPLVAAVKERGLAAGPLDPALEPLPAGNPAFPE